MISPIDLACQHIQLTPPNDYASPVYFTFTATLVADGYADVLRQQELIECGLTLLRQSDAADSDYLRLRVVEKDRVWVTLTREGVTYVKPEDY